MSFIISTTGNIASVSFPELGKTFTHPMSAYDLESEFPIERILAATSIVNAVESNWILAVYNGQVLPLPQPTTGGGGGAVDSVFGRIGVVTAQSGDYTTTLVTEGTNLYYTNARARLAISESITGIDYDNTTGVFSLTSGYTIPTTAQLSSYLTSNQTITLSSEASGSGTTSISVTLSNSAVIAKLLTGYTSGAGSITSSDSILTAIQKLDGNIDAIPQQHAYVSATFDGAGGVILINSTTTFMVPFTGTITEWTLLETSNTPVSSSIVIDAWKDTYTNYPPTVLGTIFGTKPSLTAAIKNQATGLSIPVTEGEIIKLNIDSASSALKIKLTFKIVRS